MHCHVDHALEERNTQNEPVYRHAKPNMDSYAVIVISQKILWNGNYSTKTVIFFKCGNFKFFVEKNYKYHRSFWKITIFILWLQFHRIFCEMIITATVIFRNIDLENLKLPDLFWDRSQLWNHNIDNNSFSKKRKYWCIDFTDCNYS